MKTIWVVQYNDGTADVFDEDQGPPSWPYVDAFEAKQRIAELEAQLPKVIKPNNGTCMCGNIARGFDPVHYGWKNNYCPNCGAKLNWEDA